jgi:diguanylate cyclase (GGDEF)-like protein
MCILVAIWKKFDLGHAPYAAPKRNHTAVLDGCCMKVLSGCKASALGRWLLAVGTAVFRPLGVLVFAVLLWLGTAVLCVVILLVSHEDIYQHAVQDARNLTLVLDRDILRSVELYDLSLRAVADGAADQQVMSLPEDLRNQVLFDRAATARYLGPITVYGPDGRLQVCSAETYLCQTYHTDGRWFIAHGVKTDAGLYISAPYVSGAAGGAMVVALSRQILRADGTLAGVVVGRLSVDYFRELLDGLSVGKHGGVGVVETNGTLVTRLPCNVNDIGKDFSHSPVFLRAMQGGADSFVGTASYDGVRRLYVYRHIRGLPFVVSVGAALDDVYAGWRWRVLWVALLMALFTVTVAAWAWSFVSELRRRQTEQAQLEQMAHRDALTGLENRGTFDEIWHREFLRAKRTGKPLSLLFIDIDHFKAYNDHYGHQAGDRALDRVARCIASCVRRPADHVARYGGEEFVVVLPETDGASAVSIGEEIRRAIYELNMEHVESRYGRVTISVGAASSKDFDIVDEIALIKAADMATYDAKSSGRNRVCQHALLPSSV